MASFLARHGDDLRDLFTVLGKAHDWTGDARALRDHMFRVWFGDEHGPGEEKEAYTDAQTAAARPILARMGLTQRKDPPARRYDEVLVMGAAGVGLARRAHLVVDTDVAASGLTILAGLRPHSGLPRDGSTDDWQQATERFPATAGWTPDTRLTWLSRMLADHQVDPLSAAQIVLPDETAMGIESIRRMWPTALPGDITWCPTPDAVINELGQREWVIRTWQNPGGQIPTLRLLNCAAAHRTGPDGELPSRPTSASTVSEWAAHVGATLGNGASLLMVVNQPHLARVEGQVMGLLRDLGRADLRLEVAGCATLSEVDIHLLLGEIPARMALEELP